MVIVVMGVAGSGKTTVGTLLARELGWPFYEGDDFHPQQNVDKMARGEPLTDQDRWPWLARLAALIRTLTSSGQPAIVACSALKASYRHLLAGGRGDVRFVYLQADESLIRQRLKAREGHFMRADLLASQFEALEEPQDALVVDASEAPQLLVQRIRRKLRLGPETPAP